MTKSSIMPLLISFSVLTVSLLPRCFPCKRYSKFFSKDFGGFTLIELVMVLSIILTGALILTPRTVVLLDGMQIESGARQVAADLRYAQQLAISNQKYYKFEITSGGRDYYISEQLTASPWWHQIFHARLKKEVKFKTVTLPAPGFVNGTSANMAIDFDTFGAPMPSSGGTITLRHSNNITLTKTIFIASVTGKVEIQ